MITCTYIYTDNVGQKVDIPNATEEMDKNEEKKQWTKNQSYEVSHI